MNSAANFLCSRSEARNWRETKTSSQWSRKDIQRGRGLAASHADWAGPPAPLWARWSVRASHQQGVEGELLVVEAAQVDVAPQQRQRVHLHEDGEQLHKEPGWRLGRG